MAGGEALVTRVSTVVSPGQEVPGAQRLLLQVMTVVVAVVETVAAGSLQLLMLLLLMLMVHQTPDHVLHHGAGLHESRHAQAVVLRQLRQRRGAAAGQLRVRHQLLLTVVAGHGPGNGWLLSAVVVVASLRFGSHISKLILDTNLEHETFSVAESDDDDALC